MFQKIINMFQQNKLLDHTCNLIRQLPEDAQQRICEIVLELYVLEVSGGCDEEIHRM